MNGIREKQKKKIDLSKSNVGNVYRQQNSKIRSN